MTNPEMEPGATAPNAFSAPAPGSFSRFAEAGTASGKTASHLGGELLCAGRASTSGDIGSGDDRVGSLASGNPSEGVAFSEPMSSPYTVQPLRWPEGGVYRHQVLDGDGKVVESYRSQWEAVGRCRELNQNAFIIASDLDVEFKDLDFVNKFTDEFDDAS